MHIFGYTNDILIMFVSDVYLGYLPFDAAAFVTFSKS